MNELQNRIQAYIKAQKVWAGFDAWYEEILAAEEILASMEVSDPDLQAAGKAYRAPGYRHSEAIVGVLNKKRLTSPEYASAFARWEEAKKQFNQDNGSLADLDRAASELAYIAPPQICEPAANLYMHTNAEKWKPKLIRDPDRLLFANVERRKKFTRSVDIVLWALLPVTFFYSYFLMCLLAAIIVRWSIVSSRTTKKMLSEERIHETKNTNHNFSYASEISTSLGIPIEAISFELLSSLNDRYHNEIIPLKEEERRNYYLNYSRKTGHRSDSSHSNGQWSGGRDDHLDPQFNIDGTPMMGRGFDIRGNPYGAPGMFDNQSNNSGGFDQF